MQITQNKRGIRFVPVSFPKKEALKTTLHGKRSGKPIDYLHFHDAFEIGRCVEGAGVFYVGSDIYSFSQGDFTFIKPETVHRCQSLPHTTSRWSWIFFDATRLLMDERVPHTVLNPRLLHNLKTTPVLKGEDFPDIATLLNEIFLEARDTNIQHTFALKQLLVVMLIRLHRTMGSTRSNQSSYTHQGIEGMKGIERIAPALDKMNRAFGNELRIPEMAQECGLSIRSFQTLFQQAMGMAPSEYLVQCRLHAACALLQGTQKSIGDIALECGFNSFSSFNRHFKSYRGHTPREERQQTR